MASIIFILPFIFGILFLGCIISLCKAMNRESQRRAESRQPPWKPQPYRGRQTKSRSSSRATTTPAPIQLTMCPECGATILADATVCPHCGKSRPTCMVCMHPIEFSDSVLLCPYCHGQAHRLHILEYIKVKGTCPKCLRDLDEFELISKTTDSSPDNE